jgi:biopolymer transport protein ExbD
MNVGGGGSNSQDFDLNLAPIIDCFTVLITFMLVSASFLSIGVFDAGAGAAGQSAASETPPPVVVQVELQEGNKIEMKLSGKSSQTFHFASQNGSWDFEGLKRELAGVRQKWPQTDSIILSAGTDVEYKNVILTMEQIRTAVPNILLGGF